MTEKYLHFEHRGDWYVVNHKGEIKSRNNGTFSKNWIFRGVSTHHWSNHIDVNLAEAFKSPKSIIKGIVWDIDHGTHRTWGGSYGGKIPKVQAAHVDENPKVQ